MALNHITFNDQLTHGRKLRALVNNLEDAFDQCPKMLATMLEMMTGDGTLEAHFDAYLISKFGFTNAATAKACFDLLKAYNDKVDTNASVTNVKATIKNLLDRTR